ncbi:MFS transporter [Mycena indigotica]|uniref:MFS transporter n=1 Tax=Mycena indigotica TaxID=2126181 RepID=A0A8H6S9K3_9AGAR|nr:MFS transporter [Mycena indigotica]KAF7295491.1 MFS transporter [Mycena indigotica]
MSSSLSSSSSETVTDWWFDPEESKRDEDYPKYFEEDEVIVGFKQRETPISLSTLCGVYRWTYEFPDPPEPPTEVNYSKMQTPSPGSLTISCPSGRKATLKNIFGKVEHFGRVGTFSGIKRARARDGSGLADNHWEFVTFHWKKQDRDSQADGHGLFAAAVDDDSNEPFVMFRFASGDTWLDVAAKKERRKGQTTELTTPERTRLGIGLTYPEVRTAALASATDDGGDSSDDLSEMSSLEDESERKRKNGREERGQRKKRRSA